MHGVKRSRVPPIQESAEVERKKRDKQLGMIQDYTRLVDQLQEKMKSEEYTNDTLQLSTNVLALNPEFHTGWAMRRRILVHGLLPLAESNEARQTILSQDLNLTNQSLKLNPKNYSVWEHRKWVLDTMPDADWSMEMKMVELYLEKDGRNFHTWDYRRYLIESILAITPEQQESRTKQIKKPTIESELAFTKKKIGENFSNFSAWHYRTKLLGKMWEEKGWGEENEERRKRVDEEFELVKQAIWSDPNDQSAWLYQRWLVGTGSIELVRREIEGIEELLDEEPDSRWCLDSLIHYKRLLVKLLDSETDREEREKLILECKEMLDRLVKIDPMRVNRYRDIAASINTVALWLVPSSQTSSDLNELIHTLSTTHSTPSFQSHVTLLTKLASTASLLSDLQTTLTEWKKTQTSSDLLLSFEGLGSHASSQNYFQYLFAIINLSPQLASLRQSTRSSLHSEEKRQEEDDYFPHLSLMYGLDDENKNSKEIITSLEQGGECGMTDEGYEVSSRREFVVEEVWAVRCIGKVEDWEVLGKIRMDEV